MNTNTNNQNQDTKRFDKKKVLLVSGSFSSLILIGSLSWFTLSNTVQPPEAKVSPYAQTPLALEIVTPEEEVVGVQGFYEPEENDNKNDKRLPLLPPPPKPSIERMKSNGCVADGFLSEYGGDRNSSIALINRSQCYYLHRALETWLEPPDFERAREIQEKVTKPNTVYGMFIAEALRTNKDYYFPAEERDFDFREMCREGSKNVWGEHSCKPSIAKKEYREYLRYITEEAMNMGIQSFLFGQVFYQDASYGKDGYMAEVIANMREYAQFRGMDIVIGAQTNDIADEKYLKQFDFIEGGVGLRRDGSIEEGPCFSRWYQKPGDWCWALLWHDSYQNKANNVFVHLDWSGKVGDDMSIFTRMEANKRRQALANLHDYFLKQDVGFLMPMLATLHEDNGGCSGPKDRFYSASKKYSCQDEEGINQILKKVGN
jgi:hypothetical protein